MWQLNELSPESTQFEVLRALAPECRHYLEVGVQEGRSLEQVLNHSTCELSTVTLCDTWGSVSGGSGRGGHDHLLPMLHDVFGERLETDVAFLDGDSRELLPMLLPECAGRFDVVHIDGGHHYDVVVDDLRNGWALCRRVMVVHDISFPDVWRAFYEFCQRNDDDWPIDQVRLFFGGHGTAVALKY